MWPVKGHDDQLTDASRKFMTSVLKIPQDTVSSLNIVLTRRVSQARRSKIKDEVLVKFDTVDERDVVQSYAPNLGALKGEAGIRLDFPAHLRRVFRLLESHGSLLKKRFPELKMLIKFDDSDLTLIMDVKLSPDDDWERVDEKGATESRKERVRLTEGTGTKKANPGGMAGRRALMLSSPEIGFTRGHPTPGTSGASSTHSESSWSSNANRDPEH